MEIPGQLSVEINSRFFGSIEISDSKPAEDMESHGFRQINLQGNRYQHPQNRRYPIPSIDTKSLRRWGRHILHGRLESIDDGGAGLRVLNLGGETADTKCATGKLILATFAGFAQFERDMKLERQREGILKAKAEKR